MKSDIWNEFSFTQTQIHAISTASDKIHGLITIGGLNDEYESVSTVEIVNYKTQWKYLLMCELQTGLVFSSFN